MGNEKEENPKNPPPRGNDDSSTSKSSDVEAKINSLMRQFAFAASEVKEIANASRDALSKPDSVLNFKGMYRSLEKYCSKCESIWDQLLDVSSRTSTFPTSKDKERYSLMHQYYREANVAFETITLREKQQMLDVPSTATARPTGNFTFSDARTSTNLPRITLPKFDGNFTNWPKFRDTFASIVHQDQNLTNMEKFHYLISSVVGNASAVISSFALEEANYPLAWKALQDVYDNKRLLANSYLNQLMQFKPIQGKPNVASLMKFLTQVADTISAFKLLPIADRSEFILFFLAFRCLDNSTKEQFEFSHKGVEFPTFDELTKFVRGKCVALQLTEGNLDFEISQNPSVKSTASEVKGRSYPRKSNIKHSFFTSDSKEEIKSTNKPQVKCVFCPENHSPLSCSLFYTLSPEDRLRRLKNWPGCQNCLNPLHNTENCRSKWHCRFCKARHHAMLHTSNTGFVSSRSSSSKTSNPLPNNSSSPSLHCSTTRIEDTIQVVLGTATVKFMDARGQYQKFRLVVDNGSQHSFMTTKCLHKLGLSMKPSSKRISSIGGSLFDGAQGKVYCTLQSSDCSSTFSTEALVVKTITNHLPISPVPYDIWRHFINFDLADPKFWEPAPIDFLLGADLYTDVIQGDVTSVAEDLPKLVRSAFGLVVMGRYSEPSPCLFSTCLTASSLPKNDLLSFNLSRFWELEEPTPRTQTFSRDDEAAEEHFRKTHYRTETGRYVVRLPLKEPDLDFPSSFNIAKHRLVNLETKLRRNPELSSKYHAFMTEYEELGHMEIATSPSKFVIPHHCVFKEERGKVKIRVVFNGSLKTWQGSLNEFLLTGPALQRDLRAILLNFRVFAVVFVCDAEKMYRQILVDPQDRPYQHILWRQSDQNEIAVYQLNTITYGLTPAPYLALRTLEQLAIDEGHNYPNAAKILRRDRYVDDFATGASTVQQALELQNELIQLMKLGGFNLGKWASNRPELLDAVHALPSSMSEVSWEKEDDSSIKVLGMKWDPHSDCFTYDIHVPTCAISKRGILSTVARIFDPLGFIAPFTFLMKSFIQVLWKLGLGWDDKVPTDLSDQWDQLIQQFDLLSQVKIPRFAVLDGPFTYQIVGFCDASQKGYCASLYIRTESYSNINTLLLTAKTRLAPVKTISIPRLELCGAVLLAKLYSSISEFVSQLPSTNKRPIFFCDSTIVLGWLKTPTFKLQSFVGNRVSLISELIDFSLWRHVNTHDNPSDLGSRGCLPKDLIENSQWWFGPSWLQLPEAEWPNADEFQEVELPELRVLPSSILLTTKHHLQECMTWMSKISSYERLIRVVAVLNRGMNNRKFRSLSPSTTICSVEYQAAERLCIRAVQRFYFFDGDKPDPTKLERQFHHLNPFLDSLGILRVGGRISKSKLPLSRKHPILLPPKAHLSLLIVDSYHKAFMHPGPNLQQALIQTKFWIPSLRRLIRHRSFLCLKCYKSTARSVVPMMGDLPSYRLEGGRAFLHVGVDFAGPFATRESNRRKAPQSKSYLCLFICMNTKALHLETVSNLSTDAFLASFSRFLSRRGLPSDVYSDCGTNFKGASRELQELRSWFVHEQTQDSLHSFGASRNIRWHFNPPYSPHFGGLWEAGVKSVKRHLYLAAGNAVLTFEELSTVFCKIEAILNSRPLCPLSSDPAECDYLTPGHFLIGAHLTANPEPSLLDEQENRLGRWQIVKKISEQVWNRWHLEYLSTLQARVKWRKPSDNLQVGDLVLIKSSTTPVLEWPTAKIVEVHPGSDGAVRVVTLKTPQGTYKRSVANLIPLLPLQEPAHAS